ncbi:MAG: hypothetical protein RLZZ93_940 [Actinomycetota bacterium]
MTSDVAVSRSVVHSDSVSFGVRERYAKDGEVAFLLEPNLKEGMGGLRDIHALDH